MKKIISLTLSLVIIFAFASCTNSISEKQNSEIGNSTFSDTQNSEAKNNETSKAENKTEDTNTQKNKILIAYFSRTGNTETVANMIAEKTGGKLFKIKTVNPYPDDYTECTEIAKKEQENNVRPELSAHVDNMNNYDIIFLGYPIWWGTMPMAMFTFLEEYNFSGKTVIPFCTHGGSALGESQEDIETLCTDSNVLEGLAVSGSNAENAGSDVEEWINNLNILG